MGEGAGTRERTARVDTHGVAASGGANDPGDPGDPLAEAAEEVRAWLVQLRGGAPFLSAADGALLAGWLEAGVPVAVLLRGIEQVAERRRAKRTRSPFTLVSCKATIERLAKRSGGLRPPRDLALAFAPAEPDVLVAAALEELARVDEPDLEARARQACAVLRRFHDAAWAAAKDEHPALLQDAADDLAPLRDTLGEEAFRRACEEMARDVVRARYHTLSAARVWEEFGLGVV